MDQPQPSAGQTPQDEQQATNDAQPIQVNVLSDTPDETTTDNSVAQTAPSPTAEGPVAEVAPTAPVTGADDLANVANELQAMADQLATPQVDEGLPSSSSSMGGTDPMAQIQADEASEATTVSEPTSIPVTDLSDNTTQEASDDTQTAEPEITNEPMETPQSDITASTESSSLPVEETASEQVTPSEAPSPAPMNVESQPNEAVQMANEAELQKEPTPNPADMVNEVVEPTDVAEAVATGTAGINAITGTPEPASTENAQHAALANQKAKKPSSGRGKIVTIFVLIILLFVGGSVGAFLLQSKNNTEKESSETSQNNKQESEQVATTKPTATPGDTVSATTLDDYKVTCGGGTVTNAKEYKGATPHPVVLFEKGSDDKYAMSVVAFKDKTWSPSADDVTSAQLSVCVSQNTASAKKVKTCSLTDATTKVTTSVDYYTTDYTADVYNAKTGAKLATYTVPSIVTDCPTTATYDKANPKITAKYDFVSLEKAISVDVTKTL